MLRNKDGSTGSIVILAHSGHLEDPHDAAKQDIVKLDALVHGGALLEYHLHGHGFFRDGVGDLENADLKVSLQVSLVSK